MTLCIAAHCQYDGDPHIVLCCDWLSSDDNGSSETCDKLGAIKQGWPVLIADVVHKADELIGWFESQLSTAVVTRDNALATVRRISHDYIAHLRDERSMLHYGASVPQLIKDKAFSRQEIKEISDGLSSRAQLIIATIIDGRPFIFEIENDGEVIEQSEYSIIGTTPQASAFMQWRCVTSGDDLAQVLYEVYESKRFAEMDSSIGQSTSLYVLKPSGEVFRVKESHLKAMDTLRRKYDQARRDLKFDSEVLCVRPEEFLLDFPIKREGK